MAQPTPEAVHIDGYMGNEKPGKKGKKGKKRKRQKNETSLWKNEEKQIVYSVVLAPEWRDSQDDIVGADEIEKAAHEWLIHHRMHDVQHKGEQILADPVESFIAPCDMMMGEPEQMVTKGSWVMGVKVGDPGAWAEVKSGKLTGFSIGGSAIRMKEEGDDA